MNECHMDVMPVLNSAAPDGYKLRESLSAKATAQHSFTPSSVTTGTVLGRGQDGTAFFL